MGAFNYKALDENGREHKGVMVGDSPQQIRRELRDKGLMPTEVMVATAANAKGFSFSMRFGDKLTSAEVSLMTRQLATLLSAGLPLDDALGTVSRQAEKGKTKTILFNVRAKVLEGHTLATAFAEFPQSFSQLYRATISAGEQSGRLDMVLIRLADYLERQESIQQKVANALIYPAVMSFVSICIVIFLLVFVVPKMMGVFGKMGQQLPGATQILLGVSDFLQNDGVYALAALVVFAFAMKKALQREAMRMRFHRFLLRVPLLRQPIRLINTARYARTFGILLAASVPVLDAMRIATQLTTNLALRQKLNEAINVVREGGSIARALEQTGHFPAISLQLIASGEVSGQLESMLEKAAYQQEENVSRLIDTVLSLFEPALILLMGSIVLFIVLAILLPIFEINQFVT